MKEKAIENIDAAQFLINQKLYTSSIHCSYYAVLQYMKYMLANTAKSPVSYVQQNENTDVQDSHEYLITEIKTRIDTPRNARNFAEGIRALKRSRKDADYESRKFSDSESLVCIDNAKGLIMKLKTYFGNI